MSDMAWLSIVGIGEDGLTGVPPAARPLIDGAEVLLGGERHLTMVPETHPAERLTWRAPLLDTVADIRERAGKRVCVLATGDPMSYGIGVTLGREFGAEALSVHPAPGAFSLACARLGWPLEDVTRITLHGRPLETLALHIAPQARLLILSENGETPAQVARFLADRGYGGSRMTVFAHMGGAAESVVDGTAATWGRTCTEDLNTIAVDCLAGPDAQVLPRTPGLPDAAFRHDGQLTKREVRAATLAQLAPRPGAVLWDIGAGCGSVAIEWMRAGGKAVAVERAPDRVAMIADNAAALGVPMLDLREGLADRVIAKLEGTPDAVFLGGGASEDGLAETLLDRLAPGGRFVANAVTAEGEVRLLQLHAVWGGEMTRLSVSRLTPVGPYRGWKPFMGVTQLALSKPRG